MSIAGSAMSDVRYALTLFITGITPRSLRAVANVRAFCEGEMNGSYDLEIVDLYEHPERAQPANVVVSPTLVRSLPQPVRLLFGDMSDRQQLCAVLKVA
jgi:circadian clock protein KaiB